MLEVVDFVSSARMESMGARPGIAVISINDPGSTLTTIAPGFGPVLRLAFDDLDTHDIEAARYGDVFIPSQAREIIDFLDACLRNPVVRGLMVHCEMGRSRSAAVAWFAASYGATFEHDRRIDGINTYVLGMLCEISGRHINPPMAMMVTAGYRLPV